MTQQGRQSAGTVVVTGAAGAVGSQVVRLALKAGYQVVAVDKPGASFPETELDYTIREGDLTDRRFCRGSVADGGIVVHAAAVNDPSRSYEELEAINVESVRWLYEAAEDAGARRFVYISTASLYQQRRGVLDEDAELEVTSSFSETKEEAERFLRGRRKNALAWTILRPSLMYGPKVKAFGAGILTVPPILRLFTSYLPSFTGGPRNNWVHTEDVAQAALCVATHPDAPGEVYNVADDVPLSYGEIMSAAIQALGLEIGPTIQFPHGVLMSLTRLIDREIVFKVATNLLTPLWQRIEQRYGLTSDLRPELSRSLIDYMSGDRIISNQRLKALGWEPRWPDLRDGIGETVRWYQQSRWLPDYKSLEGLDDPPEIWFGLRYQERLRGQAKMQGGDRPVEMDLDVAFPNLKKLLVDRLAMLEGTISVEGLATDSPIKGTAEIHATGGLLVYQFGWSSDDGEAYRFKGEKKLSLFRPVNDFAQLGGKISNSRGEEIAALDVELDLSREELVRTLMTIRLG